MNDSADALEFSQNAQDRTSTTPTFKHPGPTTTFCACGGSCGRTAQKVVWNLKSAQYKVYGSHFLAGTTKPSEDVPGSGGSKFQFHLRVLRAQGAVDSTMVSKHVI